MKRFFPILLVFVFLFSITGVTVASAVCKKESICNSCNSGTCQPQEKPCCSIDYTLKKIETDLQKSNERPEIPSLLLMPFWIQSFSFGNSGAGQQYLYIHYSPPLAIRDIPVLVQNFRL